MKTGDAFLVLPIPKDREPDDVKETAPRGVPTAVKVGAVAAAGVIIWEVLKWTGAILLAPETGGASLAGAAAIP